MPRLHIFCGGLQKACRVPGMLGEVSADLNLHFLSSKRAGTLQQASGRGSAGDGGFDRLNWPGREQKFSWMWASMWVSHALHCYLVAFLARESASIDLYGLKMAADGARRQAAEARGNLSKLYLQSLHLL